ncbi:MAG TPA: AMP-binding protein [Mycobacteriales bacterium]|nr:AMP-binding protein [Mycobacteriales bacterium]
MSNAPTASSDLHHPAYMPNLLVAALARHADRPAVYLGDEVLTASQVAEEMSRYVQAYASLGIAEHHPIAMLSKNRPEVLFTMGANMLTPCRSTSLHPMGSVDDQAYVLEDAGIETLVFDPSAFDDRAAELRDRVPGLKTLLSLGPSEVGTDLIALARTFEPQPLVAPVVDGEEVTGLTYTGGTTGKSKGVMQTYRSGATLTQIQLAEWEWPEDTRFLIATPLSHAGAAFFIPTLLRGGCLVVLPGFDPTGVLEAIQKYKITATMLVPTMLYILMDHPKIDDYDLSSLETVYYGAAAMSPTRLKEAIAKFGSIFFQFFGQSECGMTISVLKKSEHDTNDLARLATCGRAVPWLTVKLLDDDLNEVPDGDPGEICVRGPLVMKGYWNKPEQTAEALAGGWLHTGDIARKDGGGFLTIVDRKKDMIVSGGFNVFPREIEDVLGTHPAVAQVAVIGVPDEKWGEAVKAVVVLRPEQSVTGDELSALVKEAKGAIHAPKSVDFVEAIPLSALGKPDKKVLRARYWQGSDRLVN